MAADPTVTIGLALLVDLLLTAYAIGKSRQKATSEAEQTRKDLNGLGDFVRKEAKTNALVKTDEAKKNADRFERLEMALLLVSKNDPERRKIAEFLDGRRDS